VKTGEPRRGIGSWLFLAAVLFTWLATALLRPENIRPALTLFTQLLGEVLPVLGLVFALLFLANLFAEKAWIERHLGPGRGARAWLLALAAGVLAAGPPWPWYALAGQFMQRGVRPGIAATFLFARSLKLPLLPLLVHFFGLAFTLSLSLWLLVLAFLGGWVMQQISAAHAQTNNKTR
jgi:uncharacterized membrane protein YraQ (UPF0718 family)